MIISTKEGGCKNGTKHNSAHCQWGPCYHAGRLVSEMN
jgi:hypothetical protein